MTTKLHTFGLSNDCDRFLVAQLAEKGRGTASFIRDHELNMVKEVVLKVLRRSDLNSMENCSQEFNNGQIRRFDMESNFYIGSSKCFEKIYENEIERTFTLMTE